MCVVDRSPTLLLPIVARFERLPCLLNPYRSLRLQESYPRRSMNSRPHGTLIEYCSCLIRGGWICHAGVLLKLLLTKGTPLSARALRSCIEGRNLSFWEEPLLSPTHRGPSELKQVGKRGVLDRARSRILSQPTPAQHAYAVQDLEPHTVSAIVQVSRSWGQWLPMSRSLQAELVYPFHSISLRLSSAFWTGKH